MKVLARLLALAAALAASGCTTLGPAQAAAAAQVAATRWRLSVLRMTYHPASRLASIGSPRR